jgi:hypothetical protein
LRIQRHARARRLPACASAGAGAVQAFAERLRPALVELAELSANAAAQELDRRGYATARGGKWSAHAVITARAWLGLGGENEIISDNRILRMPAAKLLGR